MYLARKHTDMSFPEIGRFMGNKNHSTVILANRRIEQAIQADEVARRQTPAGVQEEKLTEIVAKIEKQLCTTASSPAREVVPERSAGRLTFIETAPAHEPASAMAMAAARVAG